MRILNIKIIIAKAVLKGKSIALSIILIKQKSLKVNKLSIKQSNLKKFKWHNHLRSKQKRAEINEQQQKKEEYQ